MTVHPILIGALLLNLECLGQIIDIGGIWEINCPQGCSCEIQRFVDLPLHRWIRSNEDQENSPDKEDLAWNVEHPMASEFLKVAICVISEDPEELLSKLPSDIQVFTILKSGGGDSEILLRSTTFERFTDLVSLDIQGTDYEESAIAGPQSAPETASGGKERRPEDGRLVLSVDALFPLGPTLLYLNLERVKLTSPSPTNGKRANLVVKPMNLRAEQESTTELSFAGDLAQGKGHRLIFLSQQNNGESDDKEILPYDIYKQEMEGYGENAGLFTGLGVLTHLRVYDCSLEDVSWHMFDGLNNLLYLSLERNNLKFIPEFCFYGTPDLQSLSLAGNQLLTLKSVDLAGLLMLRHLDLRGNNLTFLSELSFPPFPALQVADFRENPLDSIFPSTFEIMNTTLKLYLGGAGSKLDLRKNSFLGLRQLRTLHLYNLEMPVLERFVLQGMPALLELKMRGNVSSIDFDAFVDLPGLVDLDLSHCHLRRISMDAFYGLEKVRRIDVSNNELEVVPPGLFGLHQQKDLREIHLSRNRLTTLPVDFFKMLRGPNKQGQIQVVRLDGNPWDCSCAMTTWSPQLVSRVRETAPRCFTPKRLRNWGVFHALRKGGLRCKTPKRRQARKPLAGGNSYEDNNIVS